MFDFGNPMNPGAPMKRTTPETKTVSKCCGANVSVATHDDFNEIGKNKNEATLMTVYFICHHCGDQCKIKEVPLVEPEKTFWQKIKLGFRALFMNE